MCCINRHIDIEGQLDILADAGFTSGKCTLTASVLVVSVLLAFCPPFSMDVRLCLCAENSSQGWRSVISRRFVCVFIVILFNVCVVYRFSLFW